MYFLLNKLFLLSEKFPGSWMDEERENKSLKDLNEVIIKVSEIIHF